VYVPGAVVSERGNANLKPLGSASEALRIELTPPEGRRSSAHSIVSVNSLGLIDKLQICRDRPGSRTDLQACPRGGEAVRN
jgi:hypothetical protein